MQAPEGDNLVSWFIALLFCTLYKIEFHDKLDGPNRSLSIEYLNQLDIIFKSWKRRSSVHYSLEIQLESDTYLRRPNAIGLFDSKVPLPSGQLIRKRCFIHSALRRCSEFRRRNSAS